jgi:sucrose-6-phosphate hydrolase SacC (GH32 family)
LLRILPLVLLLAAAPARAQDEYLFSYFTGNGEDGLHLAHSADGYRWTALNGGKSLLTPTAGRDKLMRDPSIIRAPDGRFHMVWTVSWGEQGIGYASSPDLIDWTPQQYLPVMEHESEARNCWAPELLYDDATEQFTIYWATTIPGRFPATDGQTRRDERDRGYDHRIYVVTTKDFHTFSDAKLCYDHGFNVIDAAVVKTGDRYVMFLKDETDAPQTPQKNIRVAFSDAAAGPFSPPSEPITGDYWAEGPTPLKVGDRWLVYFDKYTDHKYGVVSSTDLIHWTDESDRLEVPAGMRHGTAFAVPPEVVERLRTLE